MDYRVHLPLIYSVREKVNPVDDRTFFDEFDTRLKWNNTFEDYQRFERLLEKLDKTNLESFLNKLAKESIERPSKPGRNWASFKHTLNELLGFEHLHKIGCTEIRFIQESKKKKTPDLSGITEHGSIVLLEVKTLDESDASISEFLKPIDNDPEPSLGAPNPLPRNVDEKLLQGFHQLIDYSEREHPADDTAKLICLLVIEWDFYTDEESVKQNREAIYEGKVSEILGRLKSERNMHNVDRYVSNCFIETIVK